MQILWQITSVSPFSVDQWLAIAYLLLSPCKHVTLLCQQRSIQSYGFSSSQVWMWELDYKESWALKNWCFWTVVLEKTLESPLDCKEIQPVHPKVNQYWIFIGRTDAEAETPIFWSSDVKNWLIWKDPDAGERLRAGGEGDDRGWDGWMASSTQWTWVWVYSGSWWWRAVVHWVAKSRTLLNDWTELTVVFRFLSNLVTFYVSNSKVRELLLLPV